MHGFRFPELPELEAFFDRECSSEDDFTYRFNVADKTGCAVDFSFSATEGSVQTVLSVHGRVLCSVSSEGGTRMWVENRGSRSTLLCDFDDTLVKQLRLCVRPEISVVWASLRA